jgi:tol-pal system protein YbgF
VRRTSRAAPLLAALALAGCWVPIEKGRQMEARLQRLEAQNVEQARRLDEQREVVRDRVAKVDAKIVEVQEKIDELNKAARRSGADLGVTLQRLQEEFARLRGELEVEQHRLGELEKTIAQLRSDTEGRFAALRGAGALEAYEAKQRVQKLEKPDDKAAFYALAQREDGAGDKGIARELYEEYVRRWPSDPRSADAGFRAGQLLFGQKRWREALLAYGKVAEDFPKSERAPEAMLGAADAMIRLDMKDEAKAVLEQLLERYPRSEAAKLARERLSALAPPPAKTPAAKKKAPAPPAKPKGN